MHNIDAATEDVGGFLDGSCQLVNASALARRMPRYGRFGLMGFNIVNQS